MLHRFGVSVPPRFRWECLTIRTVSWFPAPATSHVASGFPALRAPAQCTSRVMRPIRPERLPRSTAHRKLGTPRRARGFRAAIPCSTASSRILDAGTPGPDGGRGRDAGHPAPPGTDPHKQHYCMRLLSWMNSVEANSRVWMKNTRVWDPPFSQLAHPRPRQVMLLAPMDQHGPPEPDHPIAKCG